MAEPASVSAVGFCVGALFDLAINVLGGFCYDTCKDAVGFKDKWKNHDVPRAFWKGWSLTLGSCLREFEQTYPEMLGTGTKELLRGCFDALCDEDRHKEWLGQHAAAAVAPFDRFPIPAYSGDPIGKARPVVVALRAYVESRNLAKVSISDVLWQHLTAELFGKLCYYYVEVAIKDDEKARAQIQFHIAQWQCQTLAEIHEAAAATRAMVAAQGRLLSALRETLASFGEKLDNIRGLLRSERTTTEDDSPLVVKGTGDSDRWAARAGELLGRYGLAATNARPTLDALLAHSALRSASFRHLGDFVEMVGEAAVAKYDETKPPIVQRRTHDAWGDDYLHVVEFNGKHSKLFPVGVVQRAATTDDVQWFADTVLDRYRQRDRFCRGLLVTDAVELDPEAKDTALELGVDLETWTNFRGLVNFDFYLPDQTKRLRGDERYPETLYIKQRVSYEESGKAIENTDAFRTVKSWVLGKDPRFILVLGSFGTGKSFLTYELARRMATENTHVVPVLVRMKDFEKAHDLTPMLVTTLTQHGMNRPNAKGLEYMLEEGLLVVLVDGFDELAVKVGYDAAASHLERLLRPVKKHAKVLVTSRTEHFKSKADLHDNLRRLDMSLGTRLMESSFLHVAMLHPFDKKQIREYLERHWNDHAEAAKWWELLERVHDLSGLAGNPRMLSYIVQIPKEKLEKAAEGGREVTKATLYQTLVDGWLEYETQRKAHKSGKPWLEGSELLSVATELALRLWREIRSSATIDEIERTVLGRVQ